MDDQKANQNRGQLKTVEEILIELEENIRHVQRSPAMWAGSTKFPGSSNTLDSVLHALHYIWAFAQSRNEEYRSVRDAVHKERGCGNKIFSFAFQSKFPEKGEEEACEFVLSAWREIGERLHIKFPS